MKVPVIKGIAHNHPLVFGTSSLGLQTQEVDFQLLDHAFAMGIQIYDTAAFYTDGESEVVLGRWVRARQLEGQVVILTKGGHPSAYRKRITPYDICADVADSLARLQQDSIDLYLLHRDDPDVPVATIVDALNRLHDQGKIKVFGGSNWTHTRLQEANHYAERFSMVPLSVSSPNFSLASQRENPWGADCVTLSGVENQEAREFYRTNQMPVIAYAALANGLLGGGVQWNQPETCHKFMDDYSIKGYVYEENLQRLQRVEQLAEKYQVTVAQISLAWTFHQGLNLFTVVRSSNPDRLRSNLKALEIPLTKEEVQWLDLQIPERTI